MTAKGKIYTIGGIMAALIAIIFLNYIFSEIYSKYGNPIKRVYVKNVLVKAEVVTSPQKIEAGLAGRQSLAEGRGMLFVMPKIDYQRFWMQGMQFPIDIIWAAGGKVIGCEKNIQPKDDRIFTSPAPAVHVLEVPEGFCDSRGIEINDEMQIR